MINVLIFNSAIGDQYPLFDKQIFIIALATISVANQLCDRLPSRDPCLAEGKPSTTRSAPRSAVICMTFGRCNFNFLLATSYYMLAHKFDLVRPTIHLTEIPKLHPLLPTRKVKKKLCSAQKRSSSQFMIMAKIPKVIKKITSF